MLISKFLGAAEYNKIAHWNSILMYKTKKIFYCIFALTVPVFN